MYESRGGIDGARGADNKQDSGTVEFPIDTFHIQRNFAKPDDMRTEESAALRAGGKVRCGLVQCLIRNGHVAVHASRLEERSVHVMYAMRTSALVQVIDVLGTEIKLVAQLLLDLCERDMGSVRLRSEGIAATHRVEPPDKLGIGVPGSGRCDLLDAIAVPEPSRAPKGS
jgi:hypothetical protein